MRNSMLISCYGELVVGIGLLVLEEGQFVAEKEKDKPEYLGSFTHNKYTIVYFIKNKADH